MRVTIILFIITSVLVGCTKESDVPKTLSDSLLQKPLDPTVDTVETGKAAPEEWYVDKRRIRTPEHLRTMQRFTPIQVRDIYHDFKPLRSAKANPETDEVVQFLENKKISLAELKAILEEGDRLGWSQPQN